VELRAYAKIIWRYIWLIILIVGVVTAYSGYQYYKLRKISGAVVAYTSNITLQIGLVATTKSDPNPADDQSVAESLADTFVNGPILNSGYFAQDISAQIAKDPNAVEAKYNLTNLNSLGNYSDYNAVAASLSAYRTHNLVTITASWSTGDGAWAIANAIGEIATARMGQYLDYVVATDYTHGNISSTTGTVQPEVSARVINPASDPYPVPGGSMSKVTLLYLLVLLSLFLSIALAFLLNYLDDRVHNKEEIVDLLHLPIYGEVPRAPLPGSMQKSTNRA
jgi:capsular polysaccharide biosynthesis protein